MNGSIFLCDDEYWRKQKLTLPEDVRLGLSRRADAIQAEPELSVTRRTVPTHTGNIHDYISLSKYNWPNPDTPDGLPWIYRDGIVNPEYEKYDLFPLIRMCRNVGILTAVSRLSDRMECAEKAGRFLKCWFLDPETAMTPHLKFAQVTPGSCSGHPAGLIDGHFFCELLEAVASLPFTKEWTPENLAQLHRWFTDYFFWLIGDPFPRKEEALRNNHGTWYDVQFVVTAVFLNHSEIARRQLLEKSIPRLSVQLMHPGFQPFELGRTLSLTYSVFNLEGWSRLAAYAKRLGIELWNHPGCDGTTLKMGFQLLIPFLCGKQRWEHPQIGPLPNSRRLFALVNDFLEPLEEFTPGEELACIPPES